VLHSDLPGAGCGSLVAGALLIACGARLRQQESLANRRACLFLIGMHPQLLHHRLVHHGISRAVKASHDLSSDFLNARRIEVTVSDPAARAHVLLAAKQAAAELHSLRMEQQEKVRAVAVAMSGKASCVRLHPEWQGLGAQLAFRRAMSCMWRYDKWLGTRAQDFADDCNSVI
jgi:hypothetical protein